MYSFGELVTYLQLAHDFSEFIFAIHQFWAFFQLSLSRVLHKMVGYQRESGHQRKSRQCAMCHSLVYTRLFTLVVHLIELSAHLTSDLPGLSKLSSPSPCHCWEPLFSLVCRHFRLIYIEWQDQAHQSDKNDGRWERCVRVRVQTGSYHLRNLVLQNTMMSEQPASNEG